MRRSQITRMPAGSMASFCAGTRVEPVSVVT
jgi:hypothetical protein